jgi:anti-sigma factor RsiW
MLEQRTLELINAEIDGELLPGERAELEAILASSADARAMKAELQKLANLMDRMPEQAPPEDLAERILGQVRLPAARPGFSLAALFSSLQPAPVGMAFAAGLLVTVGAYEFSPGHRSDVDPASVVGTMLLDPEVQNASQADSLVISGPGVSGTVSLSSAGKLQVLSFDLESTDDAEIAISLSEAGLSFGGIARVAASEATADGSYEVSGGTLRVVNQGRQAFSVFLLEAGVDGDGKEISIGISTGGAPVFSGVLRG